MGRQHDSLRDVARPCAAVGQLGLQRSGACVQLALGVATGPRAAKVALLETARRQRQRLASTLWLPRPCCDKLSCGGASGGHSRVRACHSSMITAQSDAADASGPSHQLLQLQHADMHQTQQFVVARCPLLLPQAAASTAAPASTVCLKRRTASTTFCRAQHLVDAVAAAAATLARGCFANSNMRHTALGGPGLFSAVVAVTVLLAQGEHCVCTACRPR